MRSLCAHGVESFSVPVEGSLVAIGNFDGVHRGHVALLSRVAAEAGERGLQPVALTFSPHPVTVVGGRSVPLLTTPERRCELVARLLPELRVVVEPFTPELARSDPESFVRELLVRGLGARRVVVGANFHFGRERRGTLATLQQLGERYGFDATSVALDGDALGVFSSSRARAALARCELEEFERIVGRPHSVAGEVVHGQRLGRELGVPTANLNLTAEALPPHGIYATLVEEEAEGPSRRLGIAATNVGCRPTVGGRQVNVEAHLVGVSPDLYGRRLRVHFLSRLREEKRFASIEELRRAMLEDVAETRRRLGPFMALVPETGPWF